MYWILRGTSPPLCIIHVHQIIVFMHIQLTRYILRLKGIILIIRCIEYNLIYYFTIYLQSVPILHIPSKPLNLIDLSHITMKTSLNITRTHTSSDDWIFALDFCTGFYWIFVKNKNQQILLDFRSGVGSLDFYTQPPAASEHVLQNLF